MKATVLFWVHSIAALFFGVAFLVVPAFMSDFLAVPTDAMGTIAWRFFGLAILAFGGIAFGSRNKNIGEVRFPIMLVFFLLYIAMVLLKLALMLFADLQLNIWMWSVVGFRAVLAVWYGYFVFSRR
jgi:hypothetical protein